MNVVTSIVTSTSEERFRPMHKLTGSKRIKIQISEEEKALLKAGTVDYIGFSYYMSGTITTLETVEGQPTDDILTQKSSVIPISPRRIGMAN